MVTQKFSKWAGLCWRKHLFPGTFRRRWQAHWHLDIHLTYVQPSSWFTTSSWTVGVCSQVGSMTSLACYFYLLLSLANVFGYKHTYTRTGTYTHVCTRSRLLQDCVDLLQILSDSCSSKSTTSSTFSILVFPFCFFPSLLSLCHFFLFFSFSSTHRF